MMHCCSIAVGCGVVTVISAHAPAPTANRRSASTKYQAVRFDGPSNKLICELIEGHTGQAGPKLTSRTEAKLPEFTEMLLFAKSFIHATDFIECWQAEARGLTRTTPPDFIASSLHCVVRVAPPTWLSQCLLRLPLQPDYARSGCYQRHKRSFGQRRPRTTLLQQL